MFNSKKEPVLTATTCNKINKLCQAIEVLTGERTYLARFDFNTCRGAIVVGQVTSEVAVIFGRRNEQLEFRLDHPEQSDRWLHAMFEGDLVKVSDYDGSHFKNTVAGKFSLRWVGTSKDDRREEPLFLRQFEYCAQVRGMTLDELLRTEA